MATPNADRLSKIESWRTSAMEDSHRHLTAVSQALDEIAAGNREVAADLGLECATARAACACLDRMTGKILEESDKLKQIVKASTDVLTAGIDARNESIEIQAKLKRVNERLDRAPQFGGSSSMSGTGVSAAEIEAQREAAHVEIEALAKKSLSKLNNRTLAAIDALPPYDQTGPTTNHTPAGSGDRRSGGGDEFAARPNAGTPVRSATAWGASVDASLGSPGGYTPAGGHSPAGGSGPVGDGLAGGGSVSLQGSHYTPAQPIRPSAGPSAGPASPAVFNPLASAAAITGGATVAGYTAYQAARTARAVQTPAARPSVVRAAGAAPTTGTGRSASIVRGATTAVRTPTTGTARSASIVRGATTAVRTPTSSPASAGRPGGRTPTRNSGARILTGGRTPIPNGTGSPRGAGPSSRQAEARNASRSGARQSEARSGSPSRALSSLTGRPDKKKTRRQSNEPTQSLPVSAYEEDKTVTFLPAGCRREDNNTPPR